VRSRVLLAVGAGGSAAGLQVAAAHEQWWWRVLAVLALVAMALCALRLLPTGTFRLRRGLPAVVVLRGAVAAAFFGTEAFLPLLLVRERGWAPEWAGVVLTVSALSWSASAWFLGKVTDSRIRWRVAVLGTGLLLVGVLSVLVTAVPATPTAVAVLGWAVSGAGMGVVYSGTSLLALQLSPPEKHGAATSSLTTGEALASAGVLALAGGLFAALLPIGVAATDPAGPGPYLVAVAVALIAASTAIVAVWRTEPR
jgi:MFS family permease